MKQPSNSQLQNKLPNSQQEAIQRLKQIMNRLSVKAGEIERTQKAGLTEVLEQMPLEKLREIVDNLRSDLEKSVRFVSDQEVELTAQDQVINELKEKLILATDYEHFSLEVEIANERERKEMLEATLIGQRRNLRKQEAIYNQYWRVLRRREGANEINGHMSQTAIEPALAPFEGSLSDTELTIPKSQSPQKIALVLTAVGAFTIALLYGIRAVRQQPASNPIATPPIKTIDNGSVSALGYIEPKGEIIKLSAPAFQEGARVSQLLVKRGDKVKAKQVIAILDNRDRLSAALEEAKAKVVIAQANLEKIKAGAKTGEIAAQDARFQRTQVELQGQITTQQATISKLESQLRGEQASQKADIERIQAELTDAKKDCKRYEMLFAEGATSEQERDRVCLKPNTTNQSLISAKAELGRIEETQQEQIDEAKANLNRTINTAEREIKENQAMLASVAEVRPVDVQVAEAELNSAQAAVKRAQADLDLAYVRSPENGQILKIHTKPGELISKDGIVEFGQTDQMYVTAEVYETDIPKVHLGQEAKIQSNGILGDLQGMVDEVGFKIGQKNVLGTDPVADADSRVVEVKIRLTPEDSYKIANLTNMQVNVIIDTSDSQAKLNR
jgi:HlyD family secretion protein